MAELHVNEVLELARLRERVSGYEARDRVAGVDAALAGAIQAAGIELRPGTEGQVRELLRADVIEATAGGRAVLAGPGLVPLNDHVRSKLASAEFGHFLAGGNPGAAAGVRPMGAQERQAAALGSLSGLVADVVPVGQGLGSRIVGAAQAAQAPETSASAAIDMGQRFGLTAKPR